MKSMSSRKPTVTEPDKASTSVSIGNLNMTCWNCRCLSSSMPYFHSLIEEGSKILVISEHWLWPYDLHKLDENHRDFDAIGKSDGKLNLERDGGRGFGEIGILWHKGIGAVPISGINSDRICGIVGSKSMGI